MFKLVDVDIDGMMSRVKYMVILGLVCLCMLAAPVMADVKACSKCTPETTPAMGTDCPLACKNAFDADYWNTGNFDNDGFLSSTAGYLDPLEGKERSGVPTGSPLTGQGFTMPVVNPLSSILSGHKVDEDLSSAFTF